MKYYAVSALGYGRARPVERATGIVITEVTEDRVKGTRCNWYTKQEPKPFDVKRDGEKFSLGAGSGKARYLLRVEA